MVAILPIAQASAAEPEGRAGGPGRWAGAQGRAGGLGRRGVPEGRAGGLGRRGVPEGRGTGVLAGGARPVRLGQVALGSCRAARDELAVRVVADHERVFADDLEAVARVETLRPVILAPYADPQGARPLALEPLQRCA